MNVKFKEIRAIIAMMMKLDGISQPLWVFGIHPRISSVSVTPGSLARYMALSLTQRTIIVPTPMWVTCITSVQS